MSVDFTQIINNFLTAELGEDVRGSLVEIAEAVQDAINSQLNIVTTDLSDADSNSAIQAKVVGDLIYDGRDSIDNTPRVITYFSGGSELASLDDMPAWSMFSALGSVLQALLPEDFPGTLASGITYVIVKLAIGRSQGAYIYEIFNLPRTRIWGGYSTFSAPTEITWGIINQPADAGLTVAGAPADAAATGGRIATLEADVNAIFPYFDDAAVECYTDFEYFTGWYNNDGTIGTSGRRTQPLKIRGGQTYYLTDAANTSCLGAFLDRHGNWIAPLRGATASNPDIVVITPSYVGGENTYDPDQAARDEPDTSYYPAGNYMTLYKFTAPTNAAYFVFNTFSTANAVGYKQSVCSKPIFMVNGSGNIVIPSTDAAYQKYKNKKLCFIGPSTVMINRLYRKNANGDMVSPTTVYGYIAGMQEYLKPFFADVIGLGYSDAAYAYGRGSATGRCSIYTRICGGEENFVKDGVEYGYGVDEKDLSAYDVFVLWASGNGLTAATAGTYTDTEKTTYCGATRLIIEKIRSDNPEAEIYVGNFITQTSADPTTRGAVNVELRKMAEDMSFHIVDLEHYGGYTPETNPYFRYDDHGHPNNRGSRKNGLLLRKEILGF